MMTVDASNLLITYTTFQLSAYFPSWSPTSKWVKGLILLFSKDSAEVILNEIYIYTKIKF